MFSPPRKHHVLDPVDDEDKPGVVNGRNIARMQPALCDGLGCGRPRLGLGSL